MTLKGSYQWTLAENWAAVRLHMRQRSFRWVKVVCVVAGSAFALLMLHHLGDEDYDTTWCGAGVAYGALIVAYPWTVGVWLRRWRLSRHFGKRPDRDSTVSFEFSDGGIIQTSIHASSQMQWGIYASARANRQGVIFYMNDRIFHWVPSAAFADPADYERLLELAASKVPKFELVR